MKKMMLCLAFLTLTSCASKTPKPQYKEEKNEAKFSTSRSFTEKPENVQRAARAVLDELTHESEPQATDTVKTDGNTVYTGWVFGIAKDKYVQYDYNGTPRRKALAQRRIYGYTVTPTLAGSQVAMNVEEEIQEVDLKTGEPKGWKRVKADPAAYDMLLHRIREQVRVQ